MNVKVFLGGVFTAAALFMAGQAVFAHGNESHAPATPEQPTTIMGQMMNNSGMQRMMEAMHTPEGQAMMEACGKFMSTMAEKQEPKS